jgi:diaminohydroxyphosphoribosylaminopyrimidine deaminase/5-amino-6-(5-phosphoribosylamino)uracil reductase
MYSNEYYMSKCIDLALNGENRVRPNPHVGCIVVHNGDIIGSGYHEYFGGPHAEVNAINSVQDKSLLKESTLFVTLEPCSHWGKTPPCADLIINHHIPRVVIGMTDPFPQVAGRGIAKLKDAGIDVTCGIMEEECRQINLDFIAYHTLKRPYIIFKWAETFDGFLDNDRSATTPAPWITNNRCRELVHQWRSECDAIMVGTNTVERDNPSLTVREVEGRNPLRIIIDRTLRLNPASKVFDSEASTMIFTTEANQNRGTTLYPECSVIAIDFDHNPLNQILEHLYNRKITKLFVEGGSSLLNNMISLNLWDEARIFHSKKRVHELPGGSGNPNCGIRAPRLKSSPQENRIIDDVLLEIYYNNNITR